MIGWGPCVLSLFIPHRSSAKDWKRGPDSYPPRSKWHYVEPSDFLLRVGYLKREGVTVPSQRAATGYFFGTAPPFWKPT